MSDHIVMAHQSRGEKIWREIKGFSPQVKAAIIGGLITMIAAAVGWILVYSENSRLRAKVHELELEVLPFRNLSVQEFNRADKESMKKLAEMMATLRLDYQSNLQILNSNRLEITELKKAREEASRLIDSLTNKVEILNADVAAAQNAAEALRRKTDRTLSPEQEKQVIAIFRELPKADIVINRYDPNSEGTRLQDQLIRIFTESGFRVTSQVDLSTLPMTFRNQFMLVNSKESQPACAGPIQRTLTACGLELPGKYHPNVPTNGIQIHVAPISR